MSTAVFVREFAPVEVENMTMTKQILTGIALLPLLFSYSRAAQNWSYDGPAKVWEFSSDEGGTSSYLGIDVADVTTERLSALKLKEEEGAEITMVDQDAPAGKAGLREHDVILSMNGTTVESAAQLRRMIHETPPGRVITLGLSRDGRPLTVKVQLADRHKEFSNFVGPNSNEFPVAIPPMNIQIPEIDVPSINMVVVSQSMRSGLTLENITPQLGEFFGVKDGNGVLVRNVEKGSRADKAGFRAGDVIVKVNNEAVRDTSDFTRAVHSRNGANLTMGVVRDKKEQNLTLPLPEHKKSGSVLEESWGDVMDAESQLKLSQLQDELAKVRPEMELAIENARKSAEEARKLYCEQQKKYLVESRREAEKRRQEFRKDRELLRQQLEKMRQEMQGHWLDM
jgi:serine protease Do